ncbi:MAG: osmoprotectant transport system substrate-binding protein [Clostridia bacterium]|nr:osmoprotectant transport system substrate-binding protein [Clostridia bacterium]
MSRKYGKWLIISLLIVSLLFSVVACGQKGETPKEEPKKESAEDKKTDDPMNYEGKIKVGAQTVNESIILAHIAKHLIQEYTGLNVETSTEFAGSSVLHQAMVQKELDIYPTWTGTQLTGILRYEGPNLSKEESFKRVKEGFEKKFNFTWAKPLGFNNTYVMTVRRETAEKYNLKKASDLKEYAPKWVLGGDNNFDTRPDAYPGWSEAYGIKFKEVKPMEYSLMYQAIANKQLDVISAYSTDSRIKKLDLVMLEDDKHFFPDYSAAYVLRMDTLEKYPKLLEIVEKVSGMINEETMSSLNYKYDEGGDPDQIAKEFLKEIGLIK